MHTLYIGGLPSDASDQTLQSLFGEISGLTSVRVVTSDAGDCRGFGYVTFNSRNAVHEARRLDGTPIGEHTLRVAVAR
ncbi:MAG: RNA-binding protein [Myxococcota bacterium]